MSQLADPARLLVSPRWDLPVSLLWEPPSPLLLRARGSSVADVSGPTHPPSLAREVGARELLGLVGDWMVRPGPLYKRLGAAVIEAIRHGELRPGTRLPAERDIAKAFAIGRNTVVAAMDQLRNDGWLETRRSSGSWVRHHGRMPLLADLDISGTAGRARQLSRHLVYPPAGPIDLGVASPYGLTPVLAEVMRSPRGVDCTALSNGLDPLGTVSLRAAICDHLGRRGLDTSVPQVIVVNGAQQALTIAAALIVQPGDHVLLQSPSFPGAIDAFARAGARFASFAHSGPEWDLNAVRPVVEKVQPRAIYLMPGGHNPTGTVMPKRVRRAFADLAGEYGVFVIEDNSLEDLVFDLATPTAPIGAYDRAGCVVTIGSLSKSAWGGLRIGWLRACDEVAFRLAQVKVTADIGLPTLAQAVGCDVLMKLEEIAAERRSQVQQHFGVAHDCLQEHLPDFAYSLPESGMSLWIRIPHGNADGFAQAALRAGVVITAGSTYCVDDAYPDHFRASVAVHPPSLRVAIARLAEAWTAYAASCVR